MRDLQHIQTISKISFFVLRSLMNDLKDSDSVGLASSKELINEKTFLEMKVKANRKNGTPIRLFPGSAKYPVEDRFRQLADGESSTI